MKLYKQLSIEDREKIYCLKREGISLNQIAKRLKRSASTISRELRRNASKRAGYLPDTADCKARSRRYKLECKIERYPTIKAFVLEKLCKEKWSPEIISGRMKAIGMAVRISHETIYQYIYSLAGQLSKLYNHLMYRRPKRHLHGMRRHRRDVPPEYKLESRPHAANAREEFGHFEGDLTFFKGSSSKNLLVLIERMTRKAFIVQNNSKKSISTINKIFRIFAPMKQSMRKSITFDNGKEFSKFGALSLISTDVYFCEPASPWQKGQVERLNAQLHKYIPKKSDINSVTLDSVSLAQDKLNNLPRKVLNFLTPNEAWAIHSNISVALQI